MRNHAVPGLAVAVLFLVGLISGCRTVQQPAVLPEPVADPGDLALGTGDKFDVRVFGEPDFTGTYRVDPDGTISYPYLGQLHVEGMKPNELARRIEGLLAAKYLQHPQVSILIQEQVSKKITINGQVAHPGTFACTSNMNIVEAITVAGGFTPIAKKNATTITRRKEDGQTYTIEVEVTKIAEGKARNVAVRPGDIINVPESIF